MFSVGAVTVDPVILCALLVCTAGLGAVCGHGVRRILERWQQARLRAANGEPLIKYMRSSDSLREVVDFGTRPAPVRVEAMLRLQVDHMREIQQIWGKNTRDSTVQQVATIMRNSLRSGDGGPSPDDCQDIVNEIRGDGFTILVPGAAEADAAIIARRLGRALSRSRIEGLADNLRLSASFGVAGRRAGESFSQWRARAQSALVSATARGENQIVEASVVEDLRLLPPPDPAPVSGQAA